MSISTQPTARQASLQRALSSRLSANSALELHVAKNTAAHGSGPASIDSWTSMKHPHSSICFQPNCPQAVLCQPVLAHAARMHSEGLLPALASETASQIQAQKQLSLDVEQACCIPIVQPEGSAEPSVQSRKQLCLDSNTCPHNMLMQHAARLQAEFAGMKDGTAVITDKAAWVVAARQAAQEVQEAARAKVVRAFKIALHHMDEETLMTKMAASLQLALSPQQEATIATDHHSGLQAPQTLHCPKKARSSRCRRPASAASQGMAKLPSLSRPLSAPAERSGWEWGSELPATTSALLQAVEVAAAAEPTSGNAVLSLPLSLRFWSHQHPQQLRSDDEGNQHSADHAALQSSQEAAAATTAASLHGIGMETHMAQGPAAQSCNDTRKLNRDGLGVKDRRLECESASTSVLKPMVRRPTVQEYHVATPWHELVSMSTQASRSSAYCSGPSAINLPPEAPVGSHHQFHQAVDQSMPASGPVLLSRRRLHSGLTALHMSPQQRGGTYTDCTSSSGLPNGVGPVLQSPFAALAHIPVHPAQTSVLSKLVRAEASQHPSQLSSKPSLATQAVSHSRQAKLPVSCDHLQPANCGIQKQLRAEVASETTMRPNPLARLPLSPSSIRLNTDAGTLQPLASSQHTAVHTLCGTTRKRSFAQSQEQCLRAAAEPDLTVGRCMPQTELLPGRNVVVAAAHVNDLTHLQILPSQWCWVARIDKVLTTHMKVSWYRKHNGRWTLARYIAGPDEGQVRTGDVSLSDHQVLAVFDRFTGNKEVPSDVLVTATARLSSKTGQESDGDQENMRLPASI